MLSRQQLVGGIVAVVIVAIAGYGIWLGASKSADPYRHLTLTREVEMDEATRAYFESRLATTKAAIAATEASGGDVDLDLYLSASSDAYSLGDLVTAREMLEKQIAGNAINYVAWNNYAIVLEAMNDLKNAEVAFQKTIELEPGSEKYYADYIAFLTIHYPGRQAEIKALYEADVAMVGQTVWNMAGLGAWYAAQKDCDQAQAHYEVAVVLAPNDQTLKDDFRTAKLTCKE